eukprot:gene24555-10166_t
MSQMAVCREQQMGASYAGDPSRAYPAWPVGGMQQVEQHDSGPGAQDMRPLAEAVQHKGGTWAQGMRPLTEAVEHKGVTEAQGVRPLAEAVQHKGGTGAQEQEEARQQEETHQARWQEEPLAKGIQARQQGEARQAHRKEEPLTKSLSNRPTHMLRRKPPELTAPH